MSIFFTIIDQLNYITKLYLLSNRSVENLFQLFDDIIKGTYPLFQQYHNISINIPLNTLCLQFNITVIPSWMFHKIINNIISFI